MERTKRLAAGTWRDARHALRGMRRRPGFAVLSIATLALGIGVNATSVAVAHGILARPLPYAEPSRVVIINLLFADGGDLGFSASALRDWLPRLRTVETAAGYYRREVTVRAAGQSTVVPAALVTEQFFSVLGTAAAVGQLPSPTSPADVVVGQRVLRQIMNSDASDIVGAPVSISEEPRARADASGALSDDRSAQSPGSSPRWK